MNVPAAEQRSRNGSTAIALGTPRFADPALARLAREAGDVAAWRAAFAKHGQRAPAAVTGDFAIGLHDDQGRSWLALDRFSVRSLCYRVSDGRLHFAERADALGDGHSNSQPGTPVDLDPQAIFDYLYFHCIPSPRTIFKDVHRLPPGHCALFETGRLTVTPYWVPEFHEPRGAVSFPGLRNEFRTLLRGAVARQLDGGKPGCFLSGGTDSSTVAGMIRVASGRAAATYSIGFEAEGYDEMAFARIAARHFGTEHHEYYVTPDDLVRSIAHVAGHYDQPFGNSSALPAFYCARMASDDGVTSILAGDGGDELFGGNSRYAKQRVFGWYGLLPTGIRRRLMEPFFELPAVARMPILKKGTSYIEQAKVPMPERLQMYNLLLRLGIEEVLTPAFLARVEPGEPARQQRQVWNAARAENEVDRTLAYDWRYTLAESDLPKVCGTTQLAGIAVGFPFLDAGLLEFSMRLPSAYKLRNLKLRWFFKEALRGFLPEEILAKRKQGFGLPFGVWLTRHAALKTLAVDALDSLKTRGIVRPAFIDTLIGKRLAEHPGYYGEMVWILMTLELWMQRRAPQFKL
jgi:asparagine synthase (glutamine-hydrolysing)